MYKQLASLLPKNLVEWIEKQLNYMDIHIEGKTFAGFIFFITLGLSIAIALNLQLFLGIPFIAVFILSFTLVGGLLLYWLWIVSESRAKFVEKILPDALQLIASNIKAGLITERALLVSARPEFGPLEKELKTASKKIYAGEPATKVLLEMPKKIKSDLFEKTMVLLVEGIKAGGQMSELLIQLAEDIREENAVRTEIKANISVYVMMILLTSMIGAPFLLGISSFIIGQIQTEMQKSIFPTELIEQGKQTGFTKGLSFLLVKKQTNVSPITEETTIIFALGVLLITSIFASLTIGVIQTGKEKNGIKFIPFILAVSIALFYVVRFLLNNLISGSLRLM